MGTRWLRVIGTRAIGQVSENDGRLPMNFKEGRAFQCRRISVAQLMVGALASRWSDVTSVHSYQRPGPRTQTGRDRHDCGRATDPQRSTVAASDRATQRRVPDWG